MFDFHRHFPQLCSAVGLADVLSALFFLCAFNAYLGWTRDHESRVQPANLFAFSALAMFSKEPGVTVLVSDSYHLSQLELWERPCNQTSSMFWVHGVLCEILQQSPRAAYPGVFLGWVNFTQIPHPGGTHAGYAPENRANQPSSSNRACVELTSYSLSVILYLIMRSPNTRDLSTPSRFV